MPQVRTSVPPDFLSSLLALVYFMRLSLMKAAQAALGGAPCRKSGPWDENDGGFAPHQSFYLRFEVRCTPSSESIRKNHFRPRYALANLGHPSSF